MHRIERPDATREEELARPPELPAGLAQVASAIGNRSFTDFVVSSRPHPALDPAVPAWAEEGEIVLGPGSALLSGEERADVLRHEAIHVAQQRVAPAEESAGARDRAEALAERDALPSAHELAAPAPSLLAAPITGKPAKGFDHLYASEGEIVGEVVESGVTVRAARDFHGLGIEAPVDPKSQFGTASMTDLQYLACGDKAFSVLEQLAKKLREVAKGVARVNGSIAAGSPWRVENVFVVNEASRLHFADGKALMTIELKDFENAAVETAVHEASHAVFESHSHPDAAKPGDLAPDTFALRWADLYLRLSSTKPVDVPALPFKKAKPPLKAGDSAKPAGLVMVTDGLWSAGAATDGHPWDGVDEFFASAHGAFVTDEALLRELIAHFSGADGSIKAAGAELIALLKSLKDPAALKALKGVKDPTAATDAIRARESQESKIKDRLGSILDPKSMSPATVTCPGR